MAGSLAPSPASCSSSPNPTLWCQRFGNMAIFGACLSNRPPADAGLLVLWSSGQSTTCARSAVPRPSCIPLMPAKHSIDSSVLKQRPKCVSIYEAANRR